MRRAAILDPLSRDPPMAAVERQAAMGENLVYLFFLLIPLLSFLLLWKRYVTSPGLRRGRHRWFDVILFNVLACALLIGLLLLAGETYYRFFYDRPDSFGLTMTSERWFARHYRLNAQNLRDSVAVYPDRREPGKRRVTFLGDSFTAGHGIDDVERRFANLIRHRKPEWEVHVIAGIGYDTGKHLDMVDGATRSRYEFDLVVLVYNLNDVADILPGTREIYDRIYAYRERGLLLGGSWFLNTWYFRLVAASDPYVSRYYSFVADGYEGDTWERQKKRLTRIRDLVRGRGGRLAVITFPFLHDIGPDAPSGSLYRKLDDFWSGTGVAHLDLRETYRGLRPEDLVVGRYDAHPNERAQAMAAETITPFLERVFSGRE